jgi:hypothetical protein
VLLAVLAGAAAQRLTDPGATPAAVAVPAGDPLVIKLTNNDGPPPRPRAVKRSANLPAGQGRDGTP